VKNNPFAKCETCTADCIFKEERIRSEISNFDPPKVLNYNKGSFLFETGKPIVGFYVVCAGMIRELSHKSFNHDITLRLIKSGDILVSDSFLQKNDYYQTTARALTPTRVLFFDRKTFTKLTDLADNNLQVELAKNIRSLRNNIELHSCPVRTRTAHWLVKLNRWFANDLELTNSELAAIVGCSPITISKTLHKLENKGLIYKTRRELKIKDEEKLYQHAVCTD